MHRFALLGTLAVLVATAAPATGQAPDVRPVTDAMLADPPPESWLNWRRTRDGWGYSPLDQINRDNVGDLRMVWSWAMETGSQQTTPIVHDGVMYLASPGNVVQALDAATGDLLWEHRREFPTARGRGRPNRGIAIHGDRIILNTADANIVALDARTGEVAWETEVADAAKGYQYTSGSLVVDGVVISGMAGCLRFWDDGCFITGHDAATGRELWRTSTVARPGEPGGDTWGDLPMMFRGGGDAWIAGSYDAGARADVLGRGPGQAVGAGEPPHRRRRPLHQLDPRARPRHRRDAVVLPAPAGRVARHGRDLRAHPR